MKQIPRWSAMFSIVIAGIPIWSQTSTRAASTRRPATWQRTITLAAHPTRDALQRAKKVLAQRGVVKMEDESVVDFNAWLGTAVPEMNTTTSASTDPNSTGGEQNPEIYLKKNLIAARYASNGAIHTFECRVATPITRASVEIQPPRAKTCQDVFTDWAPEESGFRAAALPEPSEGNWTPLAVLETVDIDKKGNDFSDHVRLFRLNDINKQWDWYMVVRDPITTPIVIRCNVAFGCGWLNNKHDFQAAFPPSFANKPGFTIHDGSPKQEIYSSIGEFSLGVSLTGSASRPRVLGHRSFSR